jgi:uncharacterized protein (DUF111 family)
MICVLDPFAGLAGDVFLAALLDTGAPLGEVRASIAVGSATAPRRDIEEAGHT